MLLTYAIYLKYNTRLRATGHICWYSPPLVSIVVVRVVVLVMEYEYKKFFFPTRRSTLGPVVPRADGDVVLVVKSKPLPII